MKNSQSYMAADVFCKFFIVLNPFRAFFSFLFVGALCELRDGNSETP